MFLAEPVFVNIRHKSYCIPRDVMPLMVSNFGCCKQLESIIDTLLLFVNFICDWSLISECVNFIVHLDVRSHFALLIFKNKCK